MSEKISNMKGEKGFKVVTSTNPGNDGPYDVLKAFGGDVVIATLAGNFNPRTFFDGATLAEGELLHGRFDTVTVTSGNLMAYYAN